ncbi:hypothetical protein SDJN03_30177, partial [Cucurbita argyrosperma subsp. sororia]
MQSRESTLQACVCGIGVGLKQRCLVFVCVLGQRSNVKPNPNLTRCLSYPLANETVINDAAFPVCVLGQRPNGHATPLKVTQRTFFDSDNQPSFDGHEAT